MDIPDYEFERQKQLIRTLIEKEKREHWTNVNMDAFKRKVEKFFKSIYLKDYRFEYHTNTISIVFPMFKTEIQIEQLLSISYADRFVIRIFKENEPIEHYIKGEILKEPPIFSFLSSQEYVCKETLDLYNYFKENYYLMHKLN